MTPEMIEMERHKYRAGGPDIFPHLENDLASNMRRLNVVCNAAEIARAIWSYGTRATVHKTLEATMMYIHRPSRCIPHETYQETLEFVASWVPNGMNADLSKISENDRRRMMELCIEAAREHEARYRRRINPSPF